MMDGINWLRIRVFFRIIGMRTVEYICAILFMVTLIEWDNPRFEGDGIHLGIILALTGSVWAGMLINHFRTELFKDMVPDIVYNDVLHERRRRGDPV